MFSFADTPEKQVLKPDEALQKVNAGPVTDPVSEQPTTEAPEVKPTSKKPRWKFVKRFGVADKLVFPDGSEFKFRLIRLNDGSGYCSSSEVITEDEKLAENLREIAKTPETGVVEVKI